MPFSHVGVTVSNLGAAQSFYQACLNPLGYRCIRRERDQVAFGVIDPDFFICQDPSRGWPTGTHVAFAARSPEEVDNFYTAAVAAGGKPYASPKRRGSTSTTEYTASIIDIDNNAVEVTCGVSAFSNMSRAPSSSHTEQSPSLLQRLPLQTIASNLVSTISGSNDSKLAGVSSDSRAVVGTLLGAAAGAAIAYAMSKDNVGPVATGEPQPPREVTVRHTIEYRPAPRSATWPQQEPTSASSYTVRPRAIEAPPVPRSEYSVATAQTASRQSVLALPAPPAPPASSRAPNTVIPAGSSARAPSHRSSHHTSSRPASSHRTASIDPHAVPLPPSARTSFLSRAPSPPRSATTARPLTAANVARVVASSERGGNGRGVADDLETVRPEDSISQVSSGPRRPARHHHHRRERDEAAPSEARTSKTSRASKRESVVGSKVARSEVKVLGFGG